MEASKYCDKPGEGEGGKKKPKKQQDEIKAYVHQRCGTKFSAAWERKAR